MVLQLSLLYCSDSMKLPVLSLCCVAVLAAASAEIDTKQEAEKALDKVTNQFVRTERADTTEAPNAGLGIFVCATKCIRIETCTN